MRLDHFVLYLTALIVSAVGGAGGIYYAKKQLADASEKFKLDVIGIFERLLVTGSVAVGGKLLLLVPVVIAIKIVFYLSGLRKWSDILSRKEPAMAYQKVKLKADLALELIISPLFAVIVGLILRRVSG